MTATAKEINVDSDLMKTSKPETVSTSIKVPVEKYRALVEIKNATGINIQDLVIEGIDLVILNMAEEALKEVNERQTAIKEVIDKIKLDKSKEK